MALAGLIGNALAAATPPPLGPIVQVIDADEREDHADISIQFACSVRYVTSNPVSRGTGTTITLRLGPDCGTQPGTIAPELPLVGGGGQLVTAARVDSIVPGEITLQLTWSKPLDFVMAPTASGLGLKVRLLNTNKRKGNVFVAESEPAAGYSINLDSSQTQYPRETVEAAAAALQTQVYVSETDIEEEHWYRLRAGPFSTHQEAERVLKAAEVSYPRAWLAANDEQADLSVIDRAGIQSPAASGPTDPPLGDEQRAQALSAARAALARHAYPEAVDALNRLLRQPEYPARADAQELLGLVRERAGQLAQAKAEYQEYLRRYPQGAAAARVRGRLQTLAAASLAPRTTGEFGGAQDERWSMAASAAVSYQYGKDQTVSSGTTTTTNSVDSALAYGDLLLRDRGERYEFIGRVNGGYTQALGSSSGGSQDRISAAYVQLTDRNFGATVRLGRQSLASQGIVGLFDGLYAGYQTNPRWSLSAAVGLPAYTGYSVVSSQQKFATVAAEFNPFHQAVVFDTYFFDQTNAGATDRRSIGMQTRYSVAGRTAVLLADYDIAFRQLNSATLIGNTRMGQNWVVGFDVDHRRSPLLQLSNALIGQSAPDLKTLQSESIPPLTASQLRRLALDRTATSNTAVLSASRSFGERWQFMADLAAQELSGTPATPALGATASTPGVAAVAATQSTGLDKNTSVQMAGSSLLQASDQHIFSLRYDSSRTSRSTTVSWDARFVITGNWRLGPRFSVEQLNDATQGGHERLYLPQLRGDWTDRRSVFELIGGYQMVNQQTQEQSTGQVVTTTVSQRSLSVSAAYRVRF
ncbi:MAG: tetratricopeptide repeat protein [Pseudomonadota bacterium]|nr:tetratricopeptide repeat protein [Pseudomonadota bacterium]